MCSVFPSPEQIEQIIDAKFEVTFQLLAVKKFTSDSKELPDSVIIV